jgi:xanthine/CO dehydrogenase XdhC/CoxF family maturation factor
MAKVWTRIRQTIERHGSAALLSAVCAAGSVPRESGVLIVLQSDGGFFGSIGGGRLEYEAIAAARAALAPGAAKRNFATGRSASTSASGFPFEPGQAVRHLRRRDQVFHHVIETVAADLPLVALDAGGQPGARLQAEIEVDEVKRSTRCRQ